MYSSRDTERSPGLSLIDRRCRIWILVRRKTKRLSDRPRGAPDSPRRKTSSLKLSSDIVTDVFRSGSPLEAGLEPSANWTYKSRTCLPRSGRRISKSGPAAIRNERKEEEEAKWRISGLRNFDIV